MGQIGSRVNFRARCIERLLLALYVLPARSTNETLRQQLQVEAELDCLNRVAGKRHFMALWQPNTALLDSKLYIFNL